MHNTMGENMKESQLFHLFLNTKFKEEGIDQNDENDESGNSLDYRDEKLECNPCEA